MQKKVAILILTMLVAGASSLMIAQLYKYNARAKLNRKKGDNFPVTTLLSLQQTQFSTRLLADSPVFKLIVLFDPDCDHCDFEMDEIIRNSDKFRNTSILFISHKPVRELQQIKAKIENPDFPNIKAFSLPYGDLIKLFDCKVFPEIYLYGKNNKLIKSFYGITTASVILSELNR